MTDESERLDRLLKGYEEAVLNAADDELGPPSGEAAKVIAGVLKVYGYESDGSKVRTAWKRTRRARSQSGAHPVISRSNSDVPLRATFSTDGADDIDEGPEGSDN